MAILNVDGEMFYIHEFLMNFGGVWPVSKRSYVSRIMFTITLALQVAYLYLLTMGQWGSKKPIFYCVVNCFALINTIVSQITLRTNGYRMVSLVKSIIDDWRTTTDPRERNIMKRHNEIGTLLFSVSFIHIVVIGKVTESVRIPVIPKLGLLLREGTMSSDFFMLKDATELLSLITNICITSFVFGGILLFWSIAMHLSAQLQILGNRFQSFLLIKDKTESRRQLRFLVDRHNQLLKSIKTLESAFNVFVVARIINTQTITCVNDVRLEDKDETRDKSFNMVGTINSGNVTHATFQLLSLVIILWTLSSYYYAGSYLTTNCEEIGRVITECDWYDLSKDSMTSISIIILQSRMSKILTVAGMHELNLFNYTYMNLMGLTNTMETHLLC